MEEAKTEAEKTAKAETEALKKQLEWICIGLNAARIPATVEPGLRKGWITLKVQGMIGATIHTLGWDIHPGQIEVDPTQFADGLRHMCDQWQEAEQAYEKRTART